MVIVSKVRFSYENLWAVEQTCLVIPSKGGIEALKKMNAAV
jgi:hypothetical protein